MMLQVVSPGFSAFGRLWGPGLGRNMINVTPQMLNETFDTAGVSWLLLSDEEQIEQWGQIMFHIV